MPQPGYGLSALRVRRSEVGGFTPVAAVPLCVTTRHHVPGVELVVELGAYNAPRNCRRCDGPARYYVFVDGEVSVYVCPDHVGDAIYDAGGDPSALDGDLANGTV